MEQLLQLLRRDIDQNSQGLLFAQLALSRCMYLVSELMSIERKAPEAAMALDRSIVETALVGSYLALEADEDTAIRMMKGMHTYARRLRQRFLSSAPIGALALMPEVPLIAKAMASEVEAVRKQRDLYSMCVKLDQHPPFSDGALATLLYEESYAVLSNHVVHPTVLSLSRHRSGPHLPWTPMPGPWDVLFNTTGRALKHAVRPSSLEVKGAGHVASASMIALGAALARGLGEPSELLDRGAQDVRGIDGYWWSGSPARMNAALDLARMADLPTRTALNAVGFLVRVLAASDAFQSLCSDDQLICASEVIDRVRAQQRHLSRLPLARASSRPRGHAQTSTVCAAGAASNSQALLAALALVYAGQWPDSPEAVQDRLEAFDRAMPHREDLALTPCGGHLVREDVHHGKTASGVHS
jgi:hypothetical protein